jgi:NAD(P)-dependent dehydrogenase (short-subunit alcohol dehydrogenase family)
MGEREQVGADDSVVPEPVDLTGKVILITGANTGIGKATAMDLAGRGAELVMACRSPARAGAALDEVRTATGNDAVEVLPLDLADLASVRAAANEVLSNDRPLHVLVNNAGVAGQRGQTADGFELAFGTNHLGHFLLTTLLLDRLRASASPGAPARIVNVASGSHFDAKGIDLDAVQLPTRTVVGMHEYCVSKLANVAFTQQLAQRCDPAEVCAFATDPGPVHTEVWRRMPGPVYFVFRHLMRLKQPAEGAAPTIFCVTEPCLDQQSGAYVDEHSRIKPPSPEATAELGRELWERSEAWVAAPTKATGA